MLTSGYDAHYLNVYEDDFQWRGDLWKKVHEDEDAFWRGETIKLQPAAQTRVFFAGDRSGFPELIKLGELVCDAEANGTP